MNRPLIEELAAIPLLASLSPEDLKSAAPLFTLRSYAKNAIVATEGDRVEHLHFILAGSVQAFWRDEQGHQLRLGIDGPGMHFPDQALGGEPTAVSHIALSDLRLASIRRGDLDALMHRHPQITVVLLMDVVARLRRMIKRAQTLTMDDVYGRVVKLLLARAVRAGADLGVERMTHAEIGEQIGATREMVGRILRDLAKGGYLRAERGRIVILREPPERW